MRYVEITVEDMDSLRSEGSLVVITGSDSETHERVTFAGDLRPMEDVLGELLSDASCEVVLAVEEHQVLQVGAPA